MTSKSESPKTPCQACANAEADSKTHTDVFHHAEIRKLEALDIAHHLEVAQLKFDLESAQDIVKTWEDRARICFCCGNDHFKTKVPPAPSEVKP